MVLVLLLGPSWRNGFLNEIIGPGYARVLAFNGTDWVQVGSDIPVMHRLILRAPA